MLDRLREDARLQVYSTGANGLADRQNWPFFIAIYRTVQNRALDDGDRRYVTRLIAALGGNQPRASESLEPSPVDPNSTGGPTGPGSNSVRKEPASELSIPPDMSRG
ncbi:MAG TPA: hypothetical protein VGS41_16735, partial [Chthonomonadales bacterium]|nr:hypothetical protein [Chthonomonadales bacterium]